MCHIDLCGTLRRLRDEADGIIDLHSLAASRIHLAKDSQNAPAALI
jgi:hypothetical protein